MLCGASLRFTLLLWAACCWGVFAPCPGAAKCLPPDPRRRAPAPPRRRAPAPPRRRAPVPTTQEPTAGPTSTPTPIPTVMPTTEPTQLPKEVPTQVPTRGPTAAPTFTPTPMPTVAPTLLPTEMPTQVPTLGPTSAPTSTPTLAPTPEQTAAPSKSFASQVRGTMSLTVSEPQTFVNDPAAKVATEASIAQQAGGTVNASDVTATLSVARRLLRGGRFLQSNGVNVNYEIKVTDVMAASMLVTTLSETNGSTMAETMSDQLLVAGSSTPYEITVTEIGMPIAETTAPTAAPTILPTEVPTSEVSASPTNGATGPTTDTPTNEPTSAPTVSPTDIRTDAPTDTPTDAATAEPSSAPTDLAIDVPTNTPTDAPMYASTNEPTSAHTHSPTDAPGIAVDCMGGLQSQTCYGGVETAVYKISQPATNGGNPCPHVHDQVIIDSCTHYEHSHNWAYVVPKANWSETSINPQLPKEIPMMICPQGDRVVFSWTGAMHDVWRLPDEASYAKCSFQGAKQLHKEDVAGGLVFDCADVGVYHFACSVDNACLHGRQRMRIYVTTPSETATLRALGHWTLATFVQKYTLNFMGYASAAGFTDAVADEAIDKSVDLLANSPQSCADWLPSSLNTDTNCRAFVTTDLGFISRVRPTPDLVAAENYYDEALTLIPGMCGATSYLVELRVQQNDQYGADTKYLEACESCSMDSLDMTDIHHAYQSRGWTPPACAQMSTTSASTSFLSTSFTKQIQIDELAVGYARRSRGSMPLTCGGIAACIIHLALIHSAM